MKLSKFKSTRIVLCVPELEVLWSKPDESGHLTGPAGHILSAYINIVSSLFNATVKIPEGLESERDPTSSTMPGCLGLLQRGEADINLYPHEMPVIGIENVTQINATGVQSGIFMLAPYSVEESRRQVAVGPLDSFGSVSPSVWSLVGVTFMTFTCLLLLVRHLSRVTRRREEGLQGQSALYQVATHLIRHDSCDFSGDTARFIAVLMSSFSLFFMTIFSSVMASEKISTFKPFAYDSYEKILSSKEVQPVWLHNFDDYSQYMRAPVGSPRQKLWAHSLAISRIHKSRTPVISVDESKLAWLADLLRKKQVVYFFTEIVARLFNGAHCNNVFSTAEGVDEFKDLRFKVTADTEATPALFVLPVSRHSSSTVSDAIRHILTRSFEHALFHQPDLAIEIEELFPKIMLLSKIIYNDDRAKCMEFGKLPSDDPQAVPLDFATASQLFHWWSVGCVVSAVIFSIESIYHRLNPTRAHHEALKTRRRNKITPRHRPLRPRHPAVSVPVRRR